VINLRAHWWGSWLVPLLVIALAIAVSELGGWLLRRRGARRLETLRYKHWGKQSQLSSGTEVTAGTFQRTLSILATLATLAFRADDDDARAMLIAAFCVAAAVTSAFALRERRSRGERLFQSPVVRAFALAFVLSILIGVIAPIVLGQLLKAYVQTH
jgi:hypothetical protein